ncbi:hypothetical protein QJS04_geneDACA010912 [Acorus gramineus]|uniref:GB1/RHD3-type G domain-containing protein n=1 Tax=Acorus gramineus TaxID=55184 RepID=A0AAV9BJG0_ACOGR|nr:hypothetical protein QJS04_geneDACA010912 [Acorus gramineus]
MMQMFNFRGGGGGSASSSSVTTSSSAEPPGRSPPSATGATSRPVRLVYTDERGRFKMDPDAVAALQLVKGPIGVVSVCGRARQGKSFILNQMGGIDEAALDRLSLVTEMTKHIRVRASAGKTTASELGQFSPVFVWLLRDFYLNLVEDNRRITPRDYLELALRPGSSGGRDVSAKNELDKLRPEFRSGLDALTKFVFERTKPKQVGGTVMTGPILAGITQSFLDALNNGAVPTISSSWQSVEEAECRRAFDIASEVYMASFDRSKPPEEIMLREAHEDAIQKALDAFNANAVGSGSVRQKYEKLLQSFFRKAFEDYKKKAFVEADLRCSNTIQNMESKLRAACHVPGAKFDNVISPILKQEAHECLNLHGAMKAPNLLALEAEEALQGLFLLYQSYCLLTVYPVEAWGTHHTESIDPSTTWDRCKKTNKAVNSSMPSSLRSLLVATSQRTPQSGLQKLQARASLFTSIAKILGLEGPIFDLFKRQMAQIESEKVALMLKSRSNEDKLELLRKQLDSSEKLRAEYITRYEQAIRDKQKTVEDYTSRISDLQGKCQSFEERCASLSKSLESSGNESSQWKLKYDQVISKRKAEEEQLKAEIGVLKSRCSAAEGRLGAAREHAQAAQAEASEWKSKCDFAVTEAKLALEKAAKSQEQTNKRVQEREDNLRREFSATLAEKEAEIKDRVAKIEHAEKHVASLRSQLQAAQADLKRHESETSTLKLEIKELSEKVDSAKATAQLYESEARKLEQEKQHLEEKYITEFKRFDETESRCVSAEMEAKRATKLADNARAEAAAAVKEKSEAQQLAMQRLTEIERTQRQVENLERQKADLTEEMARLRESERVALSRAALLDATVEEREREIEKLLNENNEQRSNTVQVLENLLASERASRAEANHRAEALSLQLQSTQGKLDALQREMTSVRLNETVLDSKLKTASVGKRLRADDYTGMDSVQDMEVDGEVGQAKKRSKSTTSPLRSTKHAEDGGSVFRGDEENSHGKETESEDYMKFTVLKLKQELTKHGFGAELLQLKNPNKKDILALYEKHVLSM